MSLITFNVDLRRAAEALERIAVAVERLVEHFVPTVVEEPAEPPKTKVHYLDLAAIRAAEVKQAKEAGEDWEFDAYRPPRIGRRL